MDENPNAQLTIMPKHGSAIANITTNETWVLTIDNRTWTGNESSSILIPFLSPDSRFDFRFKVGEAQHKGEFRTAKSPWQWNTTPEAVRPGQRLDMNPGECTMAFLYRDATNETVYALTAGHCMDEIGSAVDLSNPVEDELINGVEETYLGTVAYSSQLDEQAARDWEWVPDYGFIEIDDAMRPLLNPQVTQWGGPTGSWQAGDDAVGEVVCTYGHGNVIGWTEATRPRCGEIEGRNGQAPELVMVWMQALWGDSGSPVIHESGRAAGVMTSGVIPLAGFTDLCYIHEAMRLAGLELEPLTASPKVVARPPGPPGLGIYDSGGCPFQ